MSCSPNRGMARLCLALVLLLCAATTKATAQAGTFMGRTLHITDGRSSNAAAPLVIVLHPFLGTARSIRKTTRFDRLARSRGFVVAYPEGKARRWNDGRSPQNPANDVAYLAALIAKLAKDGRVDPRRVFVAGHSNGGGMAMRMACDRPDLVAGIAVIATKLPSAYPCAKGRAVPAIFFHGSRDPIAPPQGRGADRRLGAALSEAATLANWVRRNRCASAGRPRRIDALKDTTYAELFRYKGCRAALSHVAITGHGHGWPGARPRLPRLQGPSSQEVDATALSWAFFARQ